MEHSYGTCLFVPERSGWSAHGWSAHKTTAQTVTVKFRSSFFLSETQHCQSALIGFAFLYLKRLII